MTLHTVSTEFRFFLLIGAGILAALLMMSVVSMVGIALHIVNSLIRPKRSETFLPLAPSVFGLPAEDVQYVPMYLQGEAVNELNQRLFLRMLERQQYILSSTKINGAFALRSCFLHPATQEDAVTCVCEEVLRCGERVWSEMQKEQISR